MQGSRRYAVHHPHSLGLVLETGCRVIIIMMPPPLAQLAPAGESAGHGGPFIMSRTQGSRRLNYVVLPLTHLACDQDRAVIDKVRPPQPYFLEPVSQCILLMNLR